MKKNLVKVGLFSVMLSSLVMPAFAAETYQVNNSHTGLVRELSTYFVGEAHEDGGVAEIVTYNKKDGRFYVVSGKTQSIDIVEIKSNGETEKIKTVEIGKVLEGTGINAGDMTSVSYNDEKELLAVAVQHADYDKNGAIVILDKDGNFVKSFECGVQPDMVTFTNNGKYILSANEGEPRNGYGKGAVDPKGTVTIVDVEKETTKEVEFKIDREQAIKDGVLLKKGANPEEDLEPEYITISDDDKTAFVSLQENNAIASIDIESGKINYVRGLGFIDHSLPGNEIDAVRDKNKEIKIVNENFLGTPMPDGIAYLRTIHGEFILTANEGDAREWGYKDLGQEEYENVDSKKFDDTADKKTEFLLNSETDGLADGKIYLLGGRSFSIYNANTLEKVYNSGSDFEKITAELFPDFFNTDNDDNKGKEDVKDKRSNKKGPEPENVETIRVGDKIYAIIGLERISGIMIYDVTNPTSPKYADYFNNRIFVKSVDKEEKVGLDKRGNIGPEGLYAIEAKDSPTGKPLVLVANEISGTVQVIEFNYEEKTPEVIKPVTPVKPDIDSNWDDYLVNNDTKAKTYPVYAEANFSKSSKNEDAKVERKEDKKENKKIYKFYIGKDSYEIINGEEKNSQKIDVAPIIENDRTLLPMRVIAEVLGIEVEYDEETRTAIFKQDDKIIKIQIDSDEMDVNGEKVKLYSKVKIVNDRILLPLTNISKAFDLTNGDINDGEKQNIEWNGEERTVTITKF
ncbi:copper amine oxidase N-terminal domain-containing protein [Peptoniphilus sp. MSJ-1]|uniref:Copper amine oxidase N-terminal domain-containing protein n=1 Tax=Peptoniphilus ovalis TaxID=2841503 RepID=A0ABS6FFQ8_9FIRM|nr:choice-of-anchor I family protein [Peptoniphilus ovalis]MBU5668801.1 copper amine oxidase N-terminal domain-containing protein [Peptoniphilus ovalis]